MLLPTFQTVFGINYAVVGILRGLYAGSMAGLQVPVGSPFAARRSGDDAGGGNGASPEPVSVPRNGSGLVMLALRLF